MDRNVFISKIEVYEIKKSQNQNAKNKQISINYYDKDGRENSLLTSIMTNSEVDTYKQNLLNALDCKNWTQVKYSVSPINLTTIIDADDDSRVVGFESDNGLILKNEIKFIIKSKKQND